jgi:hypothetical protein
MGVLPGSPYVAVGLGLTPFAPTTWYVWRQQRRGTASLSRALVLRGVGVFYLGCVALMIAAFVLDLAQLGRH